jgi:hypothetical protein
MVGFLVVQERIFDGRVSHASALNIAPLHE